MMRRLLSAKLTLLLVPAAAVALLQMPGILESQQLADGLPLALPEEESAYQALENVAARRRFRTLFWTRRDAEPQWFGSDVREKMLRRARDADRRFGAPDRGRDGDRGTVLVVMGEPDAIETSPRYQRFRYGQDEIVFADLEGSGVYRFADPMTARGMLNRARASLVTSPSISYDDTPRSLPKPDVSEGEWIEMRTLRSQYDRRGKAPDFPLFVALNLVRASRDRARVFLDVDVQGADIVHARPGAGDERHVTVAGRIESLDGTVDEPLRDLAVLTGPDASAHIRIPLELQPGRYRLILLAREPLLSLFSFREETFVVPEYDIPRLSTSSLIVGRPRTPQSIGGDLPLDFRLGEMVVEPRDSRLLSGPLAMMVHVYRGRGPMDVRVLADGRQIDPSRIERVGGRGEESIALVLDKTPERVELVLTDPESGQGVILVRELKGEPTMASHGLRSDGLVRAPGEASVTILDPGPDVNPIAVSGVTARSEGSVGFFQDGEMVGFSLQPPHRTAVRYTPGLPSLKLQAVALEGLQAGALRAVAEDEVELPSRTDIYVVRTTLVPLYAAVEDHARRRFVTGLSQDDFLLREDDESRAISHFEADTEDPITVAFLVDESRYMAPFLDRVRTGLSDFAAGLRDIDRGMVVTFNRDVSLDSDVTACKGCLVAAIQGSRYVDPSLAWRKLREEQAEGTEDPDLPNTRDPSAMWANPSGRLMDALEASVFRLSTYTGRKVVVVATHGNDSGSRIGADRIGELARRYGVMIYPVGLNIHRAVGDDELTTITTDIGIGEKTAKLFGFRGLFAERDAKRAEVQEAFENRIGMPSRLQALAGASGGRAFIFDVAEGGQADIHAAVRALGNELAHQYFLGFQTSSPEPGLRQLRVTVPGTDYRVRGRSAYYATSP